MNNFEAVIDVGSKNLKLGIFNHYDKSIYSSKQKINDSLEKSLNILIKDAEKYLSSHIDDVVVLYDSPKYYSLEISIKKVFDINTSIKKIYNDLIQEAHFLISQNNFKDQIIHLIINNIIVKDPSKKIKLNDEIYFEVSKPKKETLEPFNYPLNFIYYFRSYSVPGKH